MRWVCRAWATGKTRALKTQTGSLAWLCKWLHRIQQLSGFKKDICELHTLGIHSNICYQKGIPGCESDYTCNLKEGRNLMWIVDWAQSLEIFVHESTLHSSKSSAQLCCLASLIAIGSLSKSASRLSGVALIACFAACSLVGSTQQASANALKYNLNKSASPNKCLYSAMCWKQMLTQAMQCEQKLLKASMDMVAWILSASKCQFWCCLWWLHQRSISVTGLHSTWFRQNHTYWNFLATVLDPSWSWFEPNRT